jgi:hypothetical protein
MLVEFLSIYIVAQHLREIDWQSCTYEPLWAIWLVQVNVEHFFDLNLFYVGGVSFPFNEFRWV